MFRIPNFYKFETTMQDAVQVMTSYGRGDLLEGMQAMDRVWEEHASGSPRFEDDSDFYEHYEAEVNAYNKVFSEMQPLFA
jgi:hypothetical protein